MLKLQSMNLDYVRSFVVFGQSKDFKETALKLKCDSSLISRHIHALEEEFGYKLVNIDRKNGSSLTKDGEKLFAGFEKAYNILLLTEKKFNQSKELNTGKISIGISKGIDKDLVNENINNFKNKFPNVFFKIVNKDTTELYNELSKVSLDFVVDEEKNNSIKTITFKTEDLYNEEYCVLYNKKFFNKDINDIKDFNRLPFILPNENKIERKLFDNLLADKDININFVMEFDDYDDAIYHATNGIGLVLVPKRLKTKYSELSYVDLKLSKKIVVSYIDENLSPTAKEFLKEFN